MRGDFDLHRREICPRRFDRNYSSIMFELPNGGGVADGGRRT